MKPLSTIAEAKAAGCTHLELVCNACNRSHICLLDVVVQKSSVRTREDARSAFRCKRCGGRPDQIVFLNRDPKLTYFEYVVALWDHGRREIEQVLVAAQSLDEANPAFDSVRRRHPQRWVTLESRSALLRDSYRPEFVFDG